MRHGPLAGRRHVRVGHHQAPAAAVLDPLHPRVLKAQRAPGPCAGEDVAVLVAVPVDRGEDHDVGDVVDETRTGAVAGAVAVTHGPGEEVVDAGVVQHPGVEQRPVAEHRARLDNGPVAQPPDGRRRDCDHRVCRARRLLAANDRDDDTRVIDTIRARLNQLGGGCR